MKELIFEPLLICFVLFGFVHSLQILVEALLLVLMIDGCLEFILLVDTLIVLIYYLNVSLFVLSWPILLFQTEDSLALLSPLHLVLYTIILICLKYL